MLALFFYKINIKEFWKKWSGVRAESAARRRWDVGLKCT